MTRPTPKQKLRRARQNETHGNNRAAAFLYAVVANHLLSRRHLAMAHYLAKRAIKLNATSLKGHWINTMIELAALREREMKQSLQMFARHAIRRKHGRFAARWVDVQFKASPKNRKVFYESVLGVERTTAFGFLGLASAYEDSKDFDSMHSTLLDALKTKTADKVVLKRLKRLYKHFRANEMLTHLERFEAAKLRRADLLVLLSGFEASHVNAHAKSVPREKDLGQLIAELEEELDIHPEDSLDKISPLVAEFRAKSDKILGNDYKSRIDMAMAFLEMDLFSAAEDELRRVPVEDPHYGEAQCLLGGVLVKQGSDLAALESFQALLRLPTLNQVTWLEAHYQLVELYLRLGDIGQALIHLRAVESKSVSYRNLKGLKTTIEGILGGRALAPEGATAEQSGARRRKKA